MCRGARRGWLSFNLLEIWYSGKREYLGELGEGQQGKEMEEFALDRRRMFIGLL